jgi:hypothetical protein
MWLRVRLWLRNAPCGEKCPSLAGDRLLEGTFLLPVFCIYLRNQRPKLFLSTS